MVIYLHCETLLAAKDRIQFPVSQRKHKKHSDDTVDLDSLGRYVDFNPLSYIITVPRRKPQAPKNPYKHSIHLDHAVDLDSSSQYADSLPLSLPVSKRKPKKYLDDLNSSQRYASPWYIQTVPTRKPPTSLNNSRRRQTHSDDATDLNRSGLYADFASSYITIPTRKPPTSLSNSPRRYAHSDDMVDLDNLGLYADPVLSPYILSVSNHKSQTAPNKPHNHRMHSDNKADLRRYADWSPYIFTVSRPKPAKPKLKRKMYSDDVSEEYSAVSEEFLDDMSDEYSDDVSDQYSDAMLSSTYIIDTPQSGRRWNPLAIFANIDLKGISAISKLLLGNDDNKSKHSRYKEVETIIKDVSSGNRVSRRIL